MDDLKLISLVRNYRFLYDKRLADFKNNDRKQIAWEAISKELRASVYLCKRRWNALRERYTREVRKYPPSESDNKIMSPWHLFSSMTFLHTYVKQRRSRMSTMTPLEYNVIEDLSEQAIPCSPSTQSDIKMLHSHSPIDFSDELTAMSSMPRIENLLPSLTPPTDCSQPSTFPSSTKRKKRPMEKGFLKAMSYFEKACKYQSAYEDPAVEGFGQMITATVNTMSAAKKIRAMKELTALVMTIKEEPEDPL